MTSPKVLSLIISILLIFLLIAIDFIFGFLGFYGIKRFEVILIQILLLFPLIYIILLFIFYKFYEIPISNIINKNLSLLDKRKVNIYQANALKSIFDVFEIYHSELDTLKASEKKYKRLVESLENTYFLYSHNTDGIFTYVSPSIKNILGYSQEEFFTDFDKYYTDNPINKKAVEYTLNSIKGIKQKPYNLEVFNKYGNKILLDVTEIPVKDENDKVVAVEGIAKDITQENLLISKIKTNSERFKNIFDKSPIAIWEEDFSEVKKYLDTLNISKDDNYEDFINNNPDVVKKCAELIKVIDINEAVLKLHNADSKEVLLNNITSTFTEESFIAFSNELISLWNGEKEIKTDGVIKTLDGVEKEVRVICSIPFGIKNSWSRILVFMIDISDKKLFEQKLMEKEYIINSSNSYISTCNLDGIISFVNPAFLLKWKYNSINEVVNRPFWDFWEVHKDNEFIWNSLMGIGKWSGELVGIKNDGTRFDLHMSLAAVRDKNENPICFMASGIDITDRKLTENRFKLATEIGVDLVYEYDVKTNSLIWFGDIDKALGYEKGEISKNTEAYKQIINPFDVEKFSELAKKHMETYEEFSNEYRIHKKDGSWRYFYNKAVPMFDNNNIPYKWIGICTDVTEKKDIELELNEKNEVLKYSHNYIMITDESGFIKYINPALEKLIDEDLAENVLNRPFWKFLLADTKPDILMEELNRAGEWIVEMALKSEKKESKLLFRTKSLRNEQTDSISIIFIGN